MPLLSIIIPAYNSERFLPNLLSMLVSQGLDDYEVIVVNDGSTDQTENIIKNFAEKHEEIKVISIPNSGSSAARNTGLERATGKYIYFLDSDDTLAPDTLSFYKETIRKHASTDIFAFGYKSCINGKTYKKYIYPAYSNITFDKHIQYLKLFFSKRINCHICSILISNDFLKEKNILFNSGIKMGEDIEFLINIFSRVKTVFYNPRLCFIYQIRDDSTMQGYKAYSKEQFNTFVLLKNIISETKNISSDILKNANFFLANSYCSNLRYYLKSNFTDSSINQEFILNKKLLYADMVGNAMNYSIIIIIKFIPIKLLLLFFRKI